MRNILTLKSRTLRHLGVTLQNPTPTDISEGLTVVIGPNGSGKSTLGRIIEKGWNIMTNEIKSATGEKLRIRMVEFNDIHSLSGFKGEYYQQRYEATMNDEIPTVATLLGEKKDSRLWHEMCETLNINGIERKRLNFLSSGELRKLLIANMLFDMPQVLILDNPYIGLDAHSRQVLNDTIERLLTKGIAVILLVCNTDDIPLATSAVIPMMNLTIGRPQYRSEINDIELLRTNVNELFRFSLNEKDIPYPLAVTRESDDKAVVELRRCNVSYGGNVLLKDVDWTVRREECWALLGPNGSGKSTLLSLIHADNPQCYSNDVSIFGRRRGRGDSIWDVKRRIGYISSEMHLYFNGGNNTVVDVIGGGLNDTVGCFKRITPEQRQRAMQWVDLLQLNKLAEQRFNTLSAGEQRLTLLARSFIKNPELLILDEPLHGLDKARKQAIRSIVNTLARRDHSTIIYVTHYKHEIPECVTKCKVLTSPD